MIPPLHRGEVLKDRRTYTGADGQPQFRTVETWREAHRVLLKLEEANVSANALIGAVGEQGPEPSEGGGRKKRRGKGDGGPEVAPVSADRPPLRVCFEMRDKGS